MSHSTFPPWFLVLPWAYNWHNSFFFYIFCFPPPPPPAPLSFFCAYIITLLRYDCFLRGHDYIQSCAKKVQWNQDKFKKVGKDVSLVKINKLFNYLICEFSSHTTVSEHNKEVSELIKLWHTNTLHAIQVVWFMSSWEPVMLQMPFQYILHYFCPRLASVI